jgi:uncharacterized protein with HEPN domain
MQPKAQKLLEDILDAAAFSLQVTRSKALPDYESDRLLRQAVERNLEIIGEAVGRLARDDPQTAGRIGDYRHIIAFRNVLIHGYDLLDQARVWQVITDDLPRLERQVTDLLAESKSQEAK